MGILLVAFLLVGAQPAFVQDDLPLGIPGRTEGTGTYFEVTDSEYLNVSIESSEQIQVVIESIPRMIIVELEATEGSTSTQLTFSGLEPNTTYYKYEDDFYSGVSFTTDQAGGFIYTQDVTTPHLIFIQTSPSTKFIPSDTSIGTWDPVNRIYTLTTDAFETIEIVQDNLTLDGDGHFVNGLGTGIGVYLRRKHDVIIKNIEVHGFSIGIHSTWSGSYSNTLANSTITNNYFGIYFSRSPGSTLINNVVLDNFIGISIRDGSNDSTLTNNTASNGTFGIAIVFSNNITLTDNTVNSNSSIGLNIVNSTGNIITSNIINSNGNGGISLVNFHNNTLDNNSADSNNVHGVYLFLSDGNILTNNTVSNTIDGQGIYLSYSSENTLTNNTTLNNIYGIRLSSSSNNDIYNNNFLNNYIQANAYDSSNDLFNLDPPTGGNYWSDYDTPSEGCNDVNNDGFCDSPRLFVGGQDNFPWTIQDGWLDYVGPICYNVQADPNPVAVDTEAILTATVDDTGRGDSNIVSAECSLDGGEWIEMDPVDYAFDSPTEDVTATFSAPMEAGVYDLCVGGTDALGNEGDPECIFLVVYDPDAGFVTGGGWIQSPQGAYTADPLLTGKAKFGFVSKYKKGAEVPTGQTEFQFHVTDLNFHSSSYEWLVVTGSNYARFKGAGTINGDLAPDEDEYLFMLWAGDGTGDNGEDTFRIKIWYEENDVESVVYDNGFDQAIGSGSIVIHTSKK